MWRRSSVYDRIAFVGLALTCVYLGWRWASRVMG